MSRTGGAALADPAVLLAAWDAGAVAPPLARGAAVLQAAGLCEQPGALDLPLGDLGRLAADCLGWLGGLGGHEQCVLHCPECGALMEVEVPVGLAGDAADGPAERAVASRAAGSQLAVRTPTTRDLLAASGQPDPRAVLVRRCASGPDGAAPVPEELSVEQWRVLDDEFERVSGAALPTLRTACPECGADVEAVLDLPALLWERVALAGPALLRDVAALAAAFGWSERDVLALTPGRRSAYLELARA